MAKAKGEALRERFSRELGSLMRTLRPRRWQHEYPDRPAHRFAAEGIRTGDRTSVTPTSSFRRQAHIALARAGSRGVPCFGRFVGLDRMCLGPALLAEPRGQSASNCVFQLRSLRTAPHPATSPRRGCSPSSWLISLRSAVRVILRESHSAASSVDSRRAQTILGRRSWLWWRSWRRGACSMC